MPRIRSIKPEWLDDEVLASLSDSSRVASVGLILLADDWGSGRASLSWLVGRLWGYSRDDGREAFAKIERVIAELADARFIVLYEHRGQRYYHIRKWFDHQKVDHPGRPVCPVPQWVVDTMNERWRKRWEKVVAKYDIKPIDPEDPPSPPGPREDLATDQDQDQDQDRGRGRGGARAREAETTPEPKSHRGLPPPTSRLEQPIQERMGALARRAYLAEHDARNLAAQEREDYRAFEQVGAHALAALERQGEVPSDEGLTRVCRGWARRFIAERPARRLRPRWWVEWVVDMLNARVSVVAPPATRVPHLERIAEARGAARSRVFDAHGLTRETGWTPEARAEADAAADVAERELREAYARGDVPAVGT